MITIVLMYQASSCLVGVSDTVFDGLQLPSGISRRTVEKGNGRSLYPCFRRNQRASSKTVGKVFGVPRSGCPGHWRFPDLLLS
jgi:hypothetical protein